MSKSKGLSYTLPTKVSIAVSQALGYMPLMPIFTPYTKVKQVKDNGSS